MLAASAKMAVAMRVARDTVGRREEVMAVHCNQIVMQCLIDLCLWWDTCYGQCGGICGQIKMKMPTKAFSFLEQLPMDG